VFGYAVFSLLYFFYSIQVHYVIILIASNVVSITNAYLFYKFIVFKTKGNYLIEYLRFYVVYGMAIVLNLILFPLFLEFVFPFFLKRTAYFNSLSTYIPYAAQFLIIALTTVVSYVGHGKFSYRQAPLTSAPQEVR